MWEVDSLGILTQLCRSVLFQFKSMHNFIILDLQMFRYHYFEHFFTTAHLSLSTLYIAHQSRTAVSSCIKYNITSSLCALPSGPACASTSPASQLSPTWIWLHQLSKVTKHDSAVFVAAGRTSPSLDVPLHGGEGAEAEVHVNKQRT